MALSPRLDLRQSQQLVMTPQLQQAIKLLQMSNLDLQTYVTQEVEQNPLLDMAEPSSDAVSGDMNTSQEGFAVGQDGSDYSAAHQQEAGSNRDDSGPISADQGLKSDGDISGAGDSGLDADYGDNVYNNDAVSDRIDSASPSGLSDRGLSMDGGAKPSGGGGIDDRSLDQTLEGVESLKDVLDRQIALEFRDPEYLMIAGHIADMVDEAGYVPQNICTDISSRLEAAENLVDQVLLRMQSFEPTGVCARSLGECLALQLKDQNRLDPAMQIFLDHLDLLGKGDLAELKRLCGVDQEDIMDMVTEIRGLSPKPGLAYGSQTVQTLVPDVYIRKNRADLWTVELNTETLPRVLMNNYYLSELTSLSGDKETKTFISDCVSGANWLVKALDQRARTILKVSTALLKRQEGFFEYGVRFLKPLTLKDIADEIDMHESTVSRVTSNKYLSCPRGVFELKYFFSSAISSSSGGDNHSAESVKFRIKELIDCEDPKKILSDDKIVALMQSEGIDIARRTVAKYREILKIPSSVQRRRQKR